MISTQEAITAYSKELVAIVLDILVTSGATERTCKMVRAAIYDKRDIMLYKLIKTKGNINDYQKATKETNGNI
jgi:hypothetical protein